MIGLFVCVPVIGQLGNIYQARKHWKLL